MQTIHSTQEIVSIRYNFCEDSCRPFSNITLYNDSLTKPLESNNLKHLKLGDIDFIIDQSASFDRVYFAAAKGSDVIGALAEIPNLTGKTAVLEHKYDPFWEDRLGTPTVELKRMVHNGILTRSIPTGPTPALPVSIRYAQEQDFCNVMDFLESFSNPLTDNIPTEEQVRSMIYKRAIDLVLCNNIPVGFLISQVIYTELYLRNWFVAPGYRGIGIGSRLMTNFMERTQRNKRLKKQYLWINSTNENGISRFLRYGFTFDPTDRHDIYVVSR